MGWFFGDYHVSPNFLVVLGLRLWLRLGLGCDNYRLFQEDDLYLMKDYCLLVTCLFPLNNISMFIFLCLQKVSTQPFSCLSKVHTISLFSKLCTHSINLWVCSFGRRETNLVLTFWWQETAPMGRQLLGENDIFTLLSHLPPKNQHFNHVVLLYVDISYLVTESLLKCIVFS